MGQTLVQGAREAEVPLATADGERLWIPFDDLERATGWSAKPEGLCHGDVCVPIPGDRRGEWLDETARRLDYAAFARYLGHTLARDEAHGVWSLGPQIGQGATLGSGPVVAPEIALPDLDGRLGTLAEHRGKKVLLFCWASW